METQGSLHLVDMLAARRKGTVTATMLVEKALRQELAEAKALVAQRDRELAELNHRISNSLQLASSMLSLQRGRLPQPELKEALDAAIARIGAIGRFHKHLYENRIVQRVDFGKFLRELRPELSASTGLRCKVDSDQVELSGEKALNLAVAVNELVLNARKHGYDGKDGGAVTITCRWDGMDCLILSVADGGKGLPVDFRPGHANGLGMMVVSSIAKQLQGELRIENDHGARFTLLVPVP